MTPRLAVFLALLLVPLGFQSVPSAVVPPAPPAPAAAALPAAAAAEPAAAAAVPTRTLHAVFSSEDADGVVTDVNLYATAGPGGGELAIEVARYRPTCGRRGCPQVLFHAFNRVPLAEADLQLAAGLAAATLRKQGRLPQPLGPGAADLSLLLTWAAVGPAVDDEHGAGGRVRRGTVTGSVRAGGINFTPQPSVDAEIEEW